MFRPVLASLLAFTMAAPAVEACTRILIGTPGDAVFFSRTMDWPESTEPKLTVFPRGMERHGGLLAGQPVITDNPVNWTSKYGSLITSVYGIGTVDGINERGLAAHMLYLTATTLPERDPSIPGLQIGLWAQYALDNAATVTEALDVLSQVQLVMVESHGRAATVHLVLEDASGDSAIIEYIDGKAVIHHSKDYRIVTNDPPYDQQLALLAKQDFSKPSSDTPIPGNVNPIDRFQRASYFAALVPKDATGAAAIANALAIARNVSVPFGAPYRDFGIYNTEYRTAGDLNNKRYFFELTTSPNVIWAELLKFDLDPGSPVMALDPADFSLNGDVSDKFTATTEVPF